jgi:hypothetical protein
MALGSALGASACPVVPQPHRALTLQVGPHVFVVDTISGSSGVAAQPAALSLTNATFVGARASGQPPIQLRAAATLTLEHCTFQVRQTDSISTEPSPCLAEPNYPL